MNLTPAVIGLVVADMGASIAFYRRLGLDLPEDAGAEGHLEPWDAVWGMRYAVLHDPDGNPVDLFAPPA